MITEASLAFARKSLTFASRLSSLVSTLANTPDPARYVLTEPMDAISASTLLSKVSNLDSTRVTTPASARYVLTAAQ